MPPFYVCDFRKLCDQRTLNSVQGRDFPHDRDTDVYSIPCCDVQNEVERVTRAGR